MIQGTIDRVYHGFIYPRTCPRLDPCVHSVGAIEMIAGENTMPIIAPYRDDDGVEPRSCEAIARRVRL
jgi:hypothetical protein